MAYATFSDIALEMDNAQLIRLTDDQGAGEADQDVVQSFLDSASEIIDGKIGMRYSLPIDPVPTIFRRWNIDIAVYLMLGRRTGGPDDHWKVRYDNATRDLDSVATGRMGLGTEDPEEQGNKSPASFCASPRVFTRDTMREF